MESLSAPGVMNSKHNLWFWDYFPQMLNYQEARLSVARFNEFYCINSSITDHAATTNSFLYIFFSYSLVLYFAWSVYTLHIFNGVNVQERALTSSHLCSCNGDKRNIADT